MLNLKTMQEYVEEIKNGGFPVIVWGTGEKAKGTVPWLIENGITPICYCDSDSRKWGQKVNFSGQTVRKPGLT